mmetsp:Transcript_24880/g.38019  ORF Transcript_24880/g.38019 Transcript_24880/m.38019 type:complete len:222 (+) Transcript_24880:1915-2580(+)
MLLVRMKVTVRFLMIRNSATFQSPCHRHAVYAADRSCYPPHHLLRLAIGHQQVLHFRHLSQAKSPRSHRLHVSMSQIGGSFKVQMSPLDARRLTLLPHCFVSRLETSDLLAMESQCMRHVVHVVVVSMLKLRHLSAQVRYQHQVALLRLYQFNRHFVPLPRHPQNLLIFLVMNLLSAQTTRIGSLVMDRTPSFPGYRVKRLATVHFGVKHWTEKNIRILGN